MSTSSSTSAETLDDKLRRETPILAALFRDHVDRALADETKYVRMVNDLWLPAEVREEAGRRLDESGAVLNALASAGHHWLYERREGNGDTQDTE